MIFDYLIIVIDMVITYNIIGNNNYKSLMLLILGQRQKVRIVNNDSV